MTDAKVIDLMGYLKQALKQRETPCVQCGQPSTRTVKTPLNLTVPICSSPQCEREAT